MRFEIGINQPDKKNDPVLITLLFTGPDKEYIEGSDDGIYNCACTVPEDRNALIALIEQSVNACLKTYSEEMEKIIRDLVEKNAPILARFNSVCFPVEK